MVLQELAQCGKVDDAKLGGAANGELGTMAFPARSFPEIYPRTNASRRFLRESLHGQAIE